MSDGSFEGVAAIRTAFEKTWTALNNDHYGIEQVEWLLVSDQSALCTYQFRWHSELNGRPIEGHGRGTSLLTRRAGAWQVLHELLSVPQT